MTPDIDLSTYFVATNGHGGSSLWARTDNPDRPREVGILLREEADVLAAALAAVERLTEGFDVTIRPDRSQGHTLIGSVCTCGWRAGCGHDVPEQWRQHANAAPDSPTARDGEAGEPEWLDCTCGHPNADHEDGTCPFPGCGCGVMPDDDGEAGR